MKKETVDEQEAANFGAIIMVLVAIVIMITATGCSTGGYVQIGWIPVSDVSDHHQNKPERR